MTAKTVLKLRPLLCADIKAAIALDQKTLNGFWTKEGYRQEIERERGISLGITVHPKIGSHLAFHHLMAMGFAWSILDEVHLISIAVDGDWRSRGLGALLLNRLLQVAIEQGCNHATLEVNPSNQAAIALYQKFQFQELGKRKGYYGQGQDALILWLKQIQHPDYQHFLSHCFRENQARLIRSGWMLEL